ncbi:dienelactone hydrolase family protein [Sediminicola sp. 1XM1-17]|uniref:dienelactone hydrolase family protein n=1 Tax=Sediminicola sp. 1XM1-17 TaxID=3127702 RepID=UPI003076EDD9
MAVGVTYNTLDIRLKKVTLKGILFLPENTLGLVIFSHGSGSSRLSPRNNYVAEILQKEGLGTFLFDLLTEKEDSIYETRFNIDLLTQRLIEATEWLQQYGPTKNLPMGYFGASTGAASALRAAAFYGDAVRAVVSRGGRPDLAMGELAKVKAPTLLLVGGWDHMVKKLNESAYDTLRCKRKLEIIPEASHLFEEPGKLKEVAEISAKWFVTWLTSKK